MNGCPASLRVAVAAVGATIAGHAAAARGTVVAEEWSVGLLVEQTRFRVRQPEVDGAALVAQTRLEGLQGLRPFVGDAVGATLLDEDRACLDEVEGDVVAAALVAQALDPLIVTGTRPVVVLAAAQHLLYLAGSEVGLGIYRPDEGCRHEALVPGREVQQDGEPFVRPSLILGRDLQQHVLVPIAPVRGQAFAYAVRPLGQQSEDDVRPLPHDAPCLVAPRVRLLDKEIGR